jgi:hypothetical protein
MSEYVPEFEEDENDQDEQPAGRESREDHNLKQLRKKAREYDGLVSERDTIKRELEFFKAGIPDTPATRYFRKGYDGDLDVGAIRAAAAEAGFIDVEDESGEIDAEFEAMERMSDASNGGQPPNTGQITPATYAQWPREKRLAFGSKHPDLLDALKRGEEVRATF